MLPISLQTGGPQEYLGIENTYKCIREWGFEAADANVDVLLPYEKIQKKEIPAAFLRSDRDFLEMVAPWKTGAEKYGVENYQAHAPLPSYVYEAEGDGFNKALLEVMKKYVMGCDYMGCRRLIVHPFFLGYARQLTPAQEEELNMEYYAALIPVAREYGVTVCLENMFSGHRGRIYSACCSDAGFACRMVDQLNALAGEELFGFCVDTGHLLLVGLDVKNFMAQLGSRIKAFHLHDNNGLNDQHLAPYMGALDWNRFVEGLKEIPYTGALSFETFNVWHTVDHEICPDMMRMIAKTGRLFAQRAGK